MILKWCPNCKNPQAEFTSVGQGYCRECRRSRAKSKYQSDPDYKKAQCDRAKKRYERIGRFHLYGLSQDRFLQMLEEQDHRCKICLEPFSESGYNVPRIDHSHVTGRNRGLLCNTCNTGLGSFKDSAEILDRAIRYIREYDLTGK